MLFYVLSFRLSPPDTQHNLQPQLITELTHISATVETSAIVTASRRFRLWQLSQHLWRILQSAHQGSSELFVFSCFNSKDKGQTGETDADVTKTWMKNPIWAEELRYWPRSDVAWHARMHLLQCLLLQVIDQHLNNSHARELIIEKCQFEAWAGTAWASDLLRCIHASSAFIR